MRVQQLLLPALLFLSGTIAGQFALSSYTSSDGLPDDNVTCIRQDKEGFLWIGTTNGLCRFDGTHFFTFPAGLLNSNRIAGDLILDIEEEDEHMWVSHRFGLSRINKYSFACENFQTPDSGTRYSNDRAFRDICIDPKGNLWLAGDGKLLRFDRGSGTVRLAWNLLKNRPKGASTQVTKIITPGENRLLLFLGHGWAEFDISAGRLDSNLLQEIPVSYLRGENIRLRSYWNTFLAFHAVFYDTGKRTLRINTDTTNGAIGRVRNLYVDSMLTVFTNSEGKKIIARTKDGRVFGEQVSEDLPEKIVLSEFNYGCLINGLQCWGGPNGMFVPVKRPASSKEFFFSEKAAGTFNKQYSIRDVKEFDENNWLVAADAGLFLMNRSSQEIRSFPQWNDSAVYTVTTLPDRSVWLSTIDHLYHFNSSKGRILQRIYLQTYAMNLHYFDQKLLVATRSNGVLLVDLNRNTQVNFRAGDSVKKISFDRITSMKPCRNSGEFIITYNFAGQYSRNNFYTGSYDPDSVPSAASVFNERFSLTSAQPGNKQLWFGQYVGGALLYDSVTGSWTNFTRQSGLTSNYISELLIDKLGRTWIVMDGGIDIYDPKKKTLFKFPLRLRSAFRTGGFVSRSGTLVFFDRDRIIETKAELFNTDAGSKKILLSRVIQGNEQLIPRQNSLRVPYNRNSLSVIFSLQKLQPGEGTLYSYRLQEKDEWKEIGMETELNFASLQPGRYNLQLRATDEFGQWSHFGEILSITILPPFWKTWWFYLLTLLFVSAVLWMIYRYRINQLRKVLAMRAKISQDLHDEVGATLSGVTLMSELANERLKTHREAESQSIIERITAESKGMAEKMNDIVWAINPVNDSVEKVLNKIHGYGNNLCASRNIQFHFIRFDEKEEVTLNMQKRNNIYLISKEALNNAVKYSGAKNIRFILSGRRNTYVLKITDDGIGFDTSATYAGNGLVNMRVRATEIGAKLTINSEKGKGTQIELLI